jgi:hypothetical protein
VAIAVTVPSGLNGRSGNHLHGIEPAHIKARATLDALELIDVMRLFETASNTLLRTNLNTQPAAFALVFHDHKGNQFTARAGGAEVFVDVLLVLGAEVSQRTKNWVGGRLTQATQ